MKQVPWVCSTEVHRGVVWVRILRLEKDQPKRKMVRLLPFVWLIRLCGRMATKKRKVAYRLDETLSNEIIMGGNTLMIMGEKVA